MKAFTQTKTRDWVDRRRYNQQINMSQEQEATRKKVAKPRVCRKFSDKTNMSMSPPTQVQYQ